jgi:alkanesulfonate monooxygenase SsuD/methylene tetrahydromethanopterin reductase-like flavin-dependent oxidoreductase (luciferase family)
MRDATLAPRPVQSPRPPFWIAAKKRAAIERAARLGDGWYIDPVAPLQVVRRGLLDFRRALEEAGRSLEGADVILRREAYLAREPGRAWEEAREAILYNYREYLNWGHLMDEEGRPVPPGARSLEGLRPRFLVGTPEECIREVEGYRRDLGVVTHLVLRMQFPGLSQDQVLNSIRLFGEEVLPHFSP